MKLLLKIFLTIFLIFALAAGGGMFYLSRGLEAGSRQTINNIDLKAVKDGKYTGTYNSGRWSNKVSVTVKDNKITAVDIVKDVTFPKPEWTQELINRVIQKQSINVDAVAGATITSKAYLKAIEDALN